MKKVTFILTLAFALSTTLTACDKDNDKDSNNPANETQETPETPDNNTENNNGNDNDNENNEKPQMKKLKITVAGQTLTATLEDNPTARDFASLLPLTMDLTDYNQTEKIYTLSRKLTTEGAPASIDPEIGDLTYYAPWGNLAIFYKDFRTSSGLIRIGKIEGDMSMLSVQGTISNVTIEPSDEEQK